MSSSAKRAWDTYRSRIGDLTSAEDAFKDLAENIADAHVDFIAKAERRLAKQRPQERARPSVKETLRVVRANEGVPSRSSTLRTA